jgi:hypothetical protein
MTVARRPGVVVCSVAGLCHIRASGTAVPHSVTGYQTLDGGTGTVGDQLVFPTSQQCYGVHHAEVQNADVHVYDRSSLHSSFQNDTGPFDQQTIILTQQ